MAQALYRRYRPQTFEEVVGQKHVAETLRNALRQERIGHAYLFTGPRGTGKTSTARILAKAVNCQAEDVDARPDNSCPICVAINEGRLLDLIEIDAASNTSVDDVRELRDRVAFAPSEADYKVYVIDEVHMLSTSAFNALLKTLEEPPAHVIFILATTEPHKIPATVLSRCQRFDFHRIGTREITAHLDEIADLEGVQITPEGLGIIARSATGSMRDAISLLDQITAYGHVEVNAELVRDVLGMVSGAAVSDLIDVIASGDAAKVLNQLHKLIGEGVELSQLVSQMIEHLRILLLLNVGKDASLVGLPDSMLAEAKRQADLFHSTQLLHAIRVLNEAGMALKTPFAGYLPLELALLDTVGLGEVVGVSAPVEVEKRRTAKPAVPQTRPAAKVSVPEQRPAAAMVPDEDIQQQWNRIIQVIRKHSPRAQAMLRSGVPQGVKEDAFVISFRHDFHREQVEGSIDVVTEAVSSVLGRPISVRLVSDGYEPSSSATPVTRSTPTNPTPSPAPAVEAQSEPSPPSLTEDPVVRKAVDEYGAKITRVDSNDVP
ncbi:MAG: DNA polymerase III subunit gamma/tau [Chloroflexi bacterium]|nr:DNA polymerase III subunit gamma/tau [Chloroflexota bacterium]